MASKNKKSGNFLQKVKSLAADNRFRIFVGGLVFFVPAVYLALTIVSFIIYGGCDYSLLDKDAVSQAAGQYKNWGGTLGGIISNALVNSWMGISAILLPWFLILVAKKIVNPSSSVNLTREFFSNAFLMIWFSVCLGLAFPVNDFIPYVRLGGAHGNAVASYLSKMIGVPGLILLLVATMTVYLGIVFASSLPAIRAWFVKLSERFSAWTAMLKEKKSGKAEVPGIQETDSKTNPDDGLETDFPGYDGASGYKTEEYPETTDDGSNDFYESNGSSGFFPDAEENTHGDKSEAQAPANSNDVEMVVNDTNSGDTISTSEQLVDQFGEYDPTLELSHYKLPSLDLLDDKYDTTTKVDPEECAANKKRITETLDNFGIAIKQISVSPGPTVTLYEIVPADGVRISKIRSLSDDLALSLSATGIRIIAPIPGKGTVGIEVPNANPQIVPIRSVIASKEFQECTYDLPVALGKTITNDVFVTDLCKMPHLLVAGATGKGKSVGLNTMLVSLLYRKHPSQLKFVLIDPKKVEFSIYSTIENHFLAKLPDNEEAIITDVTKVVQTLRSLCKVMDTRYDLLKAAHVRNIKEYNSLFIKRKLNPEHGHHYMPYIVLLIDEFGDLIMTAGKDIELPLARIAQLARAVGIHTIIATQRPTTNIITGTIKANFPARMAFQTADYRNSQTILDSNGAEKLIGRGDMLYSTGSDLTRLQCAYVDTDEIKRVCEYISTQQGYPSAYELPEPDEADGEEGGTHRLGEVDLNKRDPMFDDCARLLVIHQSGSASLLQRKLGIGYPKAAKIMDQLEAAGIVGPQSNGGKQRQLLVQDEMQLQMILDSLNNKA